MSFGYDYKEVLRMMRDGMLDTQIARDIVRKAGLIPGDGTGGGGGGSGNGPSLLLTADPDGPSYIWDSVNNFTFMRYLRLAHDTGLGGFDAGVAYPFSWTVPITGLYRIDASVGMWRPSHATWQMVEFWVDWYEADVFGPNGFGSLGGALLQMAYDYSSSVIGADDPVVLHGTIQDILLENTRLLFTVEENTSHPDVPPNNIVLEPDPQASWVSIQLVGEPLEDVPVAE